MKRLLVVTRIFPPCSTIGGQRPLRLVRRIRDFGWEPHVLTVPPGCCEPRDDSLGRDVYGSLDIRGVRCLSLWQHCQEWRRDIGGGRKQLLRLGRAVDYALKRFMPLDIGYLWALAATDPGIRMVEHLGVDLIWATSPINSALLLARRIAMATAVPYVTDFRDVQAEGVGGRMTGWHRRNVQIERTLVRDAAGVTFVAPSQEQALIAKHPVVAGKRRCLVHNWFEADEVEACESRRFDRVTILHGGVLYGGTRRLDGFLEALALLRDRHSASSDRLQFRQHGVERTEALLAGAVGRLRLEDAVHIGEYLPREMFLSHCRGADILLLVVGRNRSIVEHAGAIPGKLYDYLSAHRPILVVGPPGCAAGTLVERLRRGIAVADDDPPRIAAAIERLLAGQCASGALDLSPKAVAEFESRGAVAKLAGFFDLLVK